MPRCGRRAISGAYLEDVGGPGVEGLLLVVEFVAAGEREDAVAAGFLQGVVSVLAEGTEVLVVARTEGEDGEPTSVSGPVSGPATHHYSTCCFALITF